MVWSRKVIQPDAISCTNRGIKPAICVARTELCRRVNVDSRGFTIESQLEDKEIRYSPFNEWHP